MRQEARAVRPLAPPRLPGAFTPAVRRALTRADPHLGRLMRQVGPLRLVLRPLHSPFAALAESIVYQQLHGRAAAAIFARLCACVGTGARLTPEALLATPLPVLREAGLSGAKAAALRDLADKARSGVLPTRAEVRRLDDAALVERFTQVRGIGTWTVEMLLIFRLGRPDVLPVDDYGVRKGFMRTYGLATPPRPRELLAWGERWRPWRTVASWYLWRAAEMAPTPPPQPLPEGEGSAAGTRRTGASRARKASDSSVAARKTPA